MRRDFVFLSAFDRHEDHNVVFSFSIFLAPSLETDGFGGLERW